MSGTIEIDPTASTAPAAPPALAAPPGTRVDLVQVGHRLGGRPVLHDVSLSVGPGELVAVAGGSGAGKTTLLQVLGGLRPPAQGAVLHDGLPAGTRAGPAVGYVPQDDIVHRELPLARGLRYAARLRLPAGTGAAEVDRIVEATLRDLDLTQRANVRVGDLSGGQRKRASTAVELLARPHLLLLDEPTSGLDPVTAAEVLRVLRRLSRRGVTVVLTTHDPADIEACDRVVFLARDGHLAFAGTPGDARRYFAVAETAGVYARLAAEGTPAGWGQRFRSHRGTQPRQPEPPPFRRHRRERRPGPGALRQWALLTGRSAEVMARSRLTLAILLGSPAAVIGMMAVLFRPGAVEAPAPGSVGAAQAVFWIAFAGFFFGLTYGLLQVVGEVPVLRRERVAGVGIGAYVLSKVAVLAPVLAVVSAGLLGVLRALDRLPAAGADAYATMFVTLLVESLAALALGLLASAAVADASQATLALPMLCFPQVLFAGAVVPVGEMSGPGRAVSALMANRWGFEGLGRALGLEPLTHRAAAMGGYRDAFSGSPAAAWVVLGISAVVFAAATVLVLHRRCGRAWGAGR
ncbi:MAG TPA: ATP-binding cassette domain-containing protein [Acidimicrobiales bacterium]